MFLHYETNKVWKHDPSVAKHAEAKGYISDWNSKVSHFQYYMTIYYSSRFDTYKASW
jgi:hypothetical protein